MESQDQHASTLPLAETASPPSSHVFRFEFTGNAKEYFRIWIVNLALTVLTLGIYSAWAKVRTQRYFHAHTRVADAHFDYIGNPWAILRGRLVLVALFLAFNFLPVIHPTLFVVVFAVVFLFTPFLIISAMRFRLHNTQWRGLNFRFHGRIGEAFKLYVLWPLGGMLTLGFLMPFVLYKQQCWIVSSAAYGQQRFNSNLDVSDYYSLMFKSLGVFLASVTTMSVIAGFIAPKFGQSNTLVSQIFIMAMLMPAYMLIFAYSRARMANLFVTGIQLGEHRFLSDMSVLDLLKLYLLNAVALVFTLGLAYPWAKVRTSQYRASCTQLITYGTLDHYNATDQNDPSAVGDEVGDYLDFDLGI